MSTTIRKTSIPGLLVIEKPTYTDNRGFFREFCRLSDLEKVGKFKPVQFNHSLSLPNVIRGIHTEKANKLIYPLTGMMFGAYLDTRLDSKNFGKVVTIRFDNVKKTCKKAIYVPSGVGNSICAVGSNPVHYIYLIDKYWTSDDARGIAWDDPDLAIDWPVKKPIISERDKNNLTMRELFPKKYKKI